MAESMTDRSGSSCPGPGAGNGRNTNGEAGPEGPASSDPAARVEKAIVSLAELGRTFSIGWFLPVSLRFKRHLGEVFVGSFFLLWFGLITPWMGRPYWTTSSWSSSRGRRWASWGDRVRERAL